MDELKKFSLRIAQLSAAYLDCTDAYERQCCLDALSQAQDDRAELHERLNGTAVTWLGLRVVAVEKSTAAPETLEISWVET